MIYCNWDVALLICLSSLVAGVDNSADELPQPGNVTLSWNPDRFSVTAQWSEPAGLEADCKVNYTVVLRLEKCSSKSTETDPFDNRRTAHLNNTWNVSTEKEICVIIQTNPMECGNKKPSRPVYKGISPPLALVKNFTCVYYSKMKMNCTWSLMSEARDLQLFYRNAENDSLKSCIPHFTNGHMKMGCHLDDIDLISEIVFFIINGTAKGSQIRNIFIISPHNSVKPEPPKLNVTMTGDRIYINYSTPNFAPYCWKYKFIYSKCNEKTVEGVTEVPEFSLEYDAGCKYTLQAQTIYSEYCGTERESEMSEPVYYGEGTDPDRPFMVAMIVTPIIVSCCLIVALVLFRRYKDIILPNIPVPALLFKDMLNSTNDGGQSKSLYVPITEVVQRDVRLEPSSTLLHPKP
ncbi:interleukin-13 receptor subunit alpha-1-like [Salminus brasiliensis]|uniref:interleukin-13 receptor subunit alpha-1-like n=1 Tax=Salminus brasiliensis TaxID=930266 RepID=UPI003B831321